MTQRVATAFVELARARGKHAVVLLFPAFSSYTLFDQEGVNIAAPLIEALTERGITVIDLLPALREWLAGRSYCEITSKPDCSGHYNVEGYAMVADIVFDRVSLALLR